MTEILVISECITPCQSPASTISFRVTVCLERVVLGTTVRIDPINTRRRLVGKGQAGGNRGRLSVAYTKNVVIRKKNNFYFNLEG